jgi:GGDEF domain-containing protein
VTRGRVLVAAATLAAVLGGLAFVTGAGALAALAGLCAIASASLAARSREPRPDARPEPSPDLAGPTEAGPFTDDGVLSQNFFEITLANRVAVARRALRPLSLVLIEVFRVGSDVGGPGAGPGGGITDRQITLALAATLRESDVSGRRDDGTYVFVLEDTGEDGAVWTAERMRRSLAAMTSDHRFRAGIASYPSHGLDVDAIVAKAERALELAREWKRDRIEVAPGT